MAAATLRSDWPGKIISGQEITLDREDMVPVFAWYDF